MKIDPQCKYWAAWVGGVLFLATFFVVPWEVNDGRNNFTGTVFSAPNNMGRVAPNFQILILEWFGVSVITLGILSLGIIKHDDSPTDLEGAIELTKARIQMINSKSCKYEYDMMEIEILSRKLLKYRYIQRELCEIKKTSNQEVRVIRDMKDDDMSKLMELQQKPAKTPEDWQMITTIENRIEIFAVFPEWKTPGNPYASKPKTK